MSENIAPQVEKLQEKLEHLEQRRLDQIESTLEELVKRQRDMERQLERYSARWGLLFMVGSAILAAIKIGWSDFAKFFGKG